MKKHNPPKTTGKYQPGSKVMVEGTFRFSHKGGMVTVSFGEQDVFFEQSDLDKWSPPKPKWLWVGNLATEGDPWVNACGEMHAKLAKLRVLAQGWEDRTHGKAANFVHKCDKDDEIALGYDELCAAILEDSN